MAVPYYDGNRGDEIGEITVVASGGAVTGEVRVAFEDAMTKDELVVTLERMIQRILNDDDWRGAPSP